MHAVVKGTVPVRIGTRGVSLSKIKPKIYSEADWPPFLKRLASAVRNNVMNKLTRSLAAPR